MARYYFNVRNGSGYTEDEEGQELGDADEAHAKAVEGALSLLSAEALTGTVDLRGRIEVTGETGEIVLLVDFQDVLEVRTGPIPRRA